jgi:hypothetical protein
MKIIVILFSASFAKLTTCKFEQCGEKERAYYLKIPST